MKWVEIFLKPFRKSFFSTISYYSENILFRSWYLFWTATFSEEEPFQEQVFFEKVTFSDSSE